MTNPMDETLQKTLAGCRFAFVAVAAFSILINLLMLTVPIYTLQLYDRVLASQSTDTLLYLTLIAVFCIVIYAFLEWLRGRISAEVAHWLDGHLSPAMIAKGIDRLLLGDRYAYQSQRDIGLLKNFLKSPSFFTFLDLPWFPIYVVAVFIISGLLGVITLIGAGILFFLAYLNQKMSSADLHRANQLSSRNQNSVDVVLDHAETVQAMGMMSAFLEKWTVNNQEMLALQSHSAQHVGSISATSKFFRIIIQIAVLAVGGYLAIEGDLTGGAMIASSIIAGRALAPVEQFISAWKDFFSAKEALQRLRKFISLPQLREKNIALPKAVGNVACEQLIYMPPGAEQPLLNNIQFALLAGESLAVLGSSGAGKSTLARLLLGVFKPTRGAVRLDGADVYTWDRKDFGAQVGYLPQDNGLIPGTVKDNIACLEKNYDESDVVAAAKMANAHEMILHLPKGYNTLIHEFQLAGGQAKRVALARTFYKNPRFIVLDEPETHLDVDGEKALLQAVEKILSEKATTLIIITRHLKLIQMMEKTLVLKNGLMQAIGPTQEILTQLQQRPQA